MKKKILVLDDDRFITLIIKSSLKLHDFEVLALTDPLLVIDTLNGGPFDLLITDLMMPGIGGKDLCARIRQNDTIKNIKILLLTAKRLDLEERKEFMEMDVSIMTKPFSPIVLIDKINASLG